MAARAPSSSEPGHGTGAADDRFEIRGKLGSGGLGVVYRAYDRRRDSIVALKTLRQVTGRDLYRFKREFRTLADVVHPNLVALHELHTVGDEWLLTMELVDGVSFIDWVRPSGEPIAETRGARSSETPRGTTRRRDDSGSFDSTNPTAVSEPPGALSARQRIIDADVRLDRLSSAIYQLVDTIHALHQAGKLHRDLKPSNVLVEASGRVVVLDFGLVSDLDALSTDLTHETSAVGTPAYMSPEQAADRPLTPATDWYSVGVMLYEALTGRRPIDVNRVGSAAAFQGKLPPPSSFDPRTPEPLERLCLALLHPDPTRRPDGAAILAALGKGPSAASQELVRNLGTTPFVGRAAELGTLRRALTETRARGCVAVFVRGASGMGKSALLRQFLDEAIGADTVVLKGRCYERESVPFKTLDTVVDSLATHLMRLSPDELDAILPRDISALARLFPVLRRVPAVAEPAVRSFQPPDPLELRRRAFGALRVLLGRMAKQSPVIVAIDDVQWGDADSGTFFAELLHHPDAPAVLLIVCHRSEDEDVTPLLAALRRSRAALGHGPVPIRELTLAPLADLEAMQLVESLHQGGGSWASTVVRESGGSPLFLSELARVGQSEPAAEPTPSLSLEHVVGVRVDRLSDDARALLAVCAAAGRPLRSHVALRAAGLGGEGSALATLCAERLLRVRHPGDGPADFETYHDRIRAAVVARLSEGERRHIHAALAAALEAVPEAERDHEALVGHFTEAGDLASAARHAAAAGLAAEERFAFHRAADLYEIAITHGSYDDGDRRAMRTRLGHALAHAGRLDHSAAVFALAADGAPAEEKLELERLELEQLLRGGRLAQGLVKSRAVLAAVGARLPGTPLGAMVSLLGQRLLLRLRGLDFVERKAAELPPAVRQRIDVLWSVSSGMSFVSPIAGKVLQVRHLREALECGEPHHVGMAFSLELGYLGMAGGKGREQLEALRERTLAIATRTGDKSLQGVAEASGGLASFLCGRWRECWDRMREGERILRDECVHVRWELDLTEFFLTSAAWYLGETRELVRLVPIYLREAEERGDVYAQRGLRGWRSNMVWLVLDQPAEARAHVQAVSMPRGAEHPTQLTHYYELLANAQIDLYTGDAWAAHARVEGMWSELKRAMLLRIQSVHIECWFLRGRAALAAAAVRPDERAKLIALAARAAREIDGQKMGWGTPLAAMLRATCARQSGDPVRAVSELRSAIAAFEAAEMKLYAAAARRCLGTQLVGDEGATLIADADALMRSQAVVAPETLSKMLAPGW